MQKPIKVQEISGEIRAKYRQEKSFEEYLENIFELYRVESVLITLFPEEMMPHEYVRANNLEEVKEIFDTGEVDDIEFSCWRDEEHFRILLQVGLSSLVILANEELLKKIESEL